MDKLTCKIDHVLCKDADNCKYYTANLQEISNRQTVSEKKHNNLSEIGITAIVLTDNRKCTNNLHAIIDIDAKLRLGKMDGEVIQYTIPAAYCSVCDSYFVFKRDYKEAKCHGTILCPVIDMTSNSKIHNNIREISSSESRVHHLGYNVRKSSGFTYKQRQIILANILENTDISKHEIESCILRPLAQHKNQPNYADAVLAWQQDLEFVKNYKLGDIPEVIIDRIIIGQRK